MSFDTVIDVLKQEAQALNTCLERLPQEREQFERALGQLQSTLDQGGKIVVTGVGKSGKVGQKIAATLSSTGSLAIFLHPTEGLHGDLGVVTAKDTVLALSQSGKSDEVLGLLPALRSLKAPLIAMTGDTQSPLASQAMATLSTWVASEACPHNLAPTTSTTLTLALGDALAVALMKMRGFEAKDFAANHPGGSLGRRLLLRVSDVMHHGEAVGTVSKDAPMKEVVLTSTEKKLGGVLVVEGTKLLGIITDGDLRRALGNQGSFFDLKAHEVMTKSPTTVTPDTMGHDALRTMEARETQISVLPVVDQDQNWKGFLRLHDLLRVF